MTTLRLPPAWLVLAVAIAAASAGAHEVGLSRGEYRFDGESLQASLAFARPDLVAILPALDSDGDGTASSEEVNAARPSLQAAIIDAIRVTSAGAACDGALTGARLMESDGLTLEGAWTCPAPSATAGVELSFLDALGFGHRHLARTGGEPGGTTTVAYRQQRTLEVPVGASEEVSGWRRVGHLLLMGVEHILTGWDHLVFLLGLLLVARGWQSILLVVTAFTLGHSLTLGLATVSGWTPSPRIIEPAVPVMLA